MTKAVMFDLGGVLIDLDASVCIENFKKLAGFEDITDYLDVCHQRGMISDLEEGLISVDEFYSQCLAHCRPGATREDVRESFCSLLRGMQPYKGELLRALYDRGYKLYALSNNNPITMEVIALQIAEGGAPMDKYFSGVFISADLKLLKPEPEIYRAAIAATGFEPSEIFYVDDSLRNVEGALAVGLDAVWYDPSTSLRDTLAHLL